MKTILIGSSFSFSKAGLECCWIIILVIILFASLSILLSIQNTLSKKISVYDVETKGIVKFQGVEVSYSDTFSQQLANVILIAIKHSPLKDIDANVEPHSPKFSKIDVSQAQAMIPRMKKVFTISHEEAWEIKINDTFYAIKIYSSKKNNWEIAIIPTGFQHYIDAVCFSLKLSGYDFINLNNALELLKKILNSDQSKKIRF